MVTMKELNPKDYPLTEEQKQNLETLHVAINKIRKAYGKPMTVTSGFRSMEDHLRVYKDKGITDQSKIPMKSKHLMGQACDISDPIGDLWKWCMINMPILKDNNLYLEDKSATPNWVHFQIVAPGSGKRIFKP